jgi:hypothetical protein
MKAVSVIAITCLLIGTFGGLAHGALSDADIVFSSVLISANIMILSTGD